MSQIEDIARTLEDLLRAIHGMHVDASEGASRHAIQQLQENSPVSVELDRDAVAKRDKATLETLRQHSANHQRDIETIFGELDSRKSELLDDPTERFFWARIDQEDANGAGEYDQWAEVQVDSNGVTKTMVAPAGRTHTSASASLWESNNVTGIPTGTVVLVHVEKGDNLQYSFEYPGNPDGIAVSAAEESLSLDKWYDISANQGWTTIDTRDWGGRWIWINLIADAGELDEFDDQFTEHWDSIAGAFAFQTSQPHAWFLVMLNSTGVQQSISRVLFNPLVAHEGDFHLRMKADGSIEMLIDNYQAQFSVRFSMRSTRQMSDADAIDIS